MWTQAATELANKPYKSLGMDLAATARATRDKTVDAFIQQSQHFQAMELAGRNPGLEIRKQV